MSARHKPEDEALLLKFLADNSDLERIELLFPDMNGVFRGKWLAPDGAAKLLKHNVRLPISSYALDIWGRDVDETELALASGDPDGRGVPIIRTLKRLPWSETPVAQVLMTLETESGEPCIYDPRQRLAAVVSRFSDLGLTAVVAVELEFYLFKKRSSPSEAPEPPSGTTDSQLYDLDVMSELEDVLREIRNGCDELDIPADTVTAEVGPGQFEINFKHIPDPLAAADHATLFKRVVWGCAVKHGLEATFMAKPYGLEAGSGMHIHISVLDRHGQNIFSSDSDGPNEKLLHAIGGTLASMRELQAIFAPHYNSYRRFAPGSFAPTSPNWGVDNRGAAVRVPEFSGPGARLEHRISGADANPYLAIAAVLGGIMLGLRDKRNPGFPIDEGGQPKQKLYSTWSRAVEGFARSGAAADIFGKDYRRVYSACRRAEIRTMAEMITDVEYKTYLDRI